MRIAAAPPDARGQFTRLIGALGRRIGQPLQPGEGRVALADEHQALRLLIELSADEDCLHVARPFLPIPDDAAQAGRLAGELLRVNADREALGAALVCAYEARHLYCLVQRMALDSPPADFVLAVEELAALGDALQAALTAADDPTPRPPDLRLHRA